MLPDSPACRSSWLKRQYKAVILSDVTFLPPSRQSDKRICAGQILPHTYCTAYRSATSHRLNTAARSDYDCKGVLPRLCIVARRLPYLLCGPVDIARLVRGSWRNGRMAPHRRECIRLLYAAPGFAGLSLSRSKGLSRTERGTYAQVLPEFSSGRNSG